jgi:hypothetical protein
MTSVRLSEARAVGLQCWMTASCPGAWTALWPRCLIEEVRGGERDRKGEVRGVRGGELRMAPACLVWTVSGWRCARLIASPRFIRLTVRSPRWASWVSLSLEFGNSTKEIPLPIAVVTGACSSSNSSPPPSGRGDDGDLGAMLSVPLANLMIASPSKMCSRRKVSRVSRQDELLAGANFSIASLLKDSGLDEKVCRVLKRWTLRWARSAVCRSGGLDKPGRSSGPGC